MAVTLCISACVFQLTREFFTKELKKHYLRNNDTDVFSATWNSVMITVSQATPVPCCWWSAISAVLSQHPQLAWVQPAPTTPLCQAQHQGLRWQQWDKGDNSFGRQAFSTRAAIGTVPSSQS